MSNNFDQQIKRKQQVADGLYDGRFRKKVIPNKKKKKNKEWAKNKNKEM